MAVARWRAAALMTALSVAGCVDARSPDAADAEAETTVEPADALDPRAAARQTLRAQEESFLSTSSPEAAPPWSAVSGPDPHLVVARAAGFVGLLRGAAALVVLDGEGRERRRIGAPTGAVGWSWPSANEVWVVGERSAEIEVFRETTAGWSSAGRRHVAGVAGLRDIAVSDRGVFVADRHRGRVLRLVAAPEESAEPEESFVVEAEASCLGVISVDVVDDVLIANCLLSHRVKAWSLADAAGITAAPVAVVEHDGPIWAVAARSDPAGGVRVAVAGVEDHPLDRSQGGFGYIDSFAYVYTVDPSARAVTRAWSRNLGELGVVTPKWMAWEGTQLLVSGAGGHVLARLDPLGARAAEVRDVPWGMTTLAGTFDDGLAANALLDAWVRLEAPDSARESWQLHAVAGAPGAAGPSAQSRLGEALVFTGMLAPQGRTEGHASRFTCETCHFEGTVDGRVHSTGRGDVHATTKTLRGLIGNRPHFSRALDRTSMDMIHNEFRVANHGTEQPPWFSIEPAETPWFTWQSAQTQQPEDLRAAVFAFLATLAPERNPATLGRHRFSASERAGAELFAQHCDGCHAPLRQADVPQSVVAFQDWEASVFAGPRLVWGSAPRVDVGVTPRVHEEGARTPSLRNLWAKRPYFTNGSAATLAEVLTQVAVAPAFTHHRGDSAAGLSRQERDDLERFIDLL